MTTETDSTGYPRHPVRRLILVAIGLPLYTVVLAALFDFIYQDISVTACWIILAVELVYTGATFRYFLIRFAQDGPPGGRRFGAASAGKWALGAALTLVVGRAWSIGDKVSVTFFPLMLVVLVIFFTYGPLLALLITSVRWALARRRGRECGRERGLAGEPGPVSPRPGS